jgi:hypothetical protein
MGTRSWLIAALVAGGVAASAAVQLTPQQAEAFDDKIQLVQKIASEGPKPSATTFTQDETNAYLKFKGADILPTGLTNPVLAIHGQGRVSGTATVDLDVVRQKKSTGGWLDPTSYLTGRLPVAASGRITTADGKGRFELEKAEISGLPLPPSFLDQLVRFFSRTADNPNGSSMNDVIDLPAGIRRIDVDQGTFTLHQ